MRILITGHTSFEGAWLAKIAEQQGFEVYGVDLVNSVDSRSFAAVMGASGLKISQQFVERFSREQCHEILSSVRPDFVFHFLQLPHSKKDLQNFADHQELNLNSLVSLVEGLKVYEYPSPKTFVYVSDRTNLQDAHSLSHSFRSQFVDFAKKHLNLPIRIVSWGSLIGSGDLREQSLVFQLMRDLMSLKKFSLKKPHSVRSFQSAQMVMMALVAAVLKEQQIGGAPADWILGPRQQDMISVGDFCQQLAGSLNKSQLLDLPNTSQGPSYHPYPDTRAFYEWLGVELKSETASEVAKWYERFFQGKSN